MTIFGRSMSGAGVFWAWFAAEAEGVANALEALVRGEADLDHALDRLNRKLRAFHPGLEADISRQLDGASCLTLAGDTDALARLLAAVPVVPGWRISRASPEPRRLMGRLAAGSAPGQVGRPLAARHEAYVM